MTSQGSMEEGNMSKNKEILGKNALLRRCLTIRKYVPALGIFLRYSYNLGDFHPDILIEAILMKKTCKV